MLDADRVIYLDHHASTPCAPEVVEAMLPHLTVEFANPSSETHAAGTHARRAVEFARNQVARLLAVAPRQVVFTSGATEALNLAISAASQASTGSIVASAIEHVAVHEALHRHVPASRRQSPIPVESDGVLDGERLEDALRKSAPGAVVIMLANNEIGTIQDLNAVSAACRRRGVLIICDASQAPTWLDLARVAPLVDYVALSGHKMYGPKGVGCLVVPSDAPSQPLIVGGTQEGGWRAGTPNVPGIVGMGVAARLCHERWQADAVRVARLRDSMLACIQSQIGDMTVNGTMRDRLPNNLSITFTSAPARAVLQLLPYIALSAGSACHAASQLPSHVLTAIGLCKTEARATLRIGLGRATSQSDVDDAARAICHAVSFVRSVGQA